MGIADSIWKNVNILTMTGKGYGLIEQGMIAVNKGLITWVGQENPPLAMQVIDGQGAYLTPGLIDCHSHLIYGGDRIDEFEQRLTGISYEEIARQGGGIMSTVRETRAASFSDLLTSSQKRLEGMMCSGVTTIEVKSGYGLDLENEIKMLKVARALNEKSPCDVISTCLSAHAVPPEYKDNPDGYVDLIIEEILPHVAEAKLATAVDGFCEGIGFSNSQMRKIFIKAKSLGFDLKLHAEQLTNQGAAALAAEFGALSVDHLERLGEKGVQAMAKSGTVAVLLPAAYYFLRDIKTPPVELLRQYKIPIAIGSDHNPGSAPVNSLNLMINMASTLFQLTPEEALLGVTKNAALALGLKDRGTLEVGQRADFALWDISHPAGLSYQIGGNPCLSVVKEGVVIF